MLYPISNKIVLKPLESIGTTQGGVILPDIEQEGTIMGTVTATGPGLLLANGKRGPMQVKENDVVTWDNTKEKPKNPKHFDGEKRDLLHDIDFKKALKKLKIPNKLLTNKNALVKYLTSNPQMMSQLLRLATEDVNENVDLPIEVGDTVMMGRFKNKKVKVKSIDWNEKGDLLINGRPALKFRIVKNGVEEKVNVVKKKGKDGGDYRDYDSPENSDFEEPYKQEENIGMGYPNEEDMKKIKKRVKKARSKSDSNKEYQYHPITTEQIDEFLIHNDIGKILKEVSNTTSQAKQMVDDGPSAFMGGMKGYGARNKSWAEKLGFNVINYILKVDVDSLPPSEEELLDNYLSMKQRIDAIPKRAPV